MTSAEFVQPQTQQVASNTSSSSSVESNGCAAPSIQEISKQLALDDAVVFELDDRPFTTNAPIPKLNPLVTEVQTTIDVTDVGEEHESAPNTPKRLSSRKHSSPIASWGRKEIMSVSDFDPVRGQKVSPCPSFALGVMLGFIPLFILLRWFIHRVRDPKHSKYWDERWLKYGRTLGLFLLVVVSIVIVIAKVM